jgi:pyruvate formate lyase activating enzyme
MKKETIIYEKSQNNAVRCGVCAHRCVIKDGLTGICKVRRNEAGILYSINYGDLVAACMDPIEKKPLYHFLPGTQTFSVASSGCNFKCSFCQNWQISQIEDEYENISSNSKKVEPEEVVRFALESKAQSISYTYTEPAIFFEFAYDTAKLASKNGLKNIFVTNGYFTRESLDVIAPYLDAANIDLKSFNNETYRKICGSNLQPVIDNIKMMKERNIWVEITTLIVPGINDSKDELKAIAEFIASIDAGIPWHISRSFPNYGLTEIPATPMETMKTAEEIGQAAGLKYIYPGNINETNTTKCPGCTKDLILRDVYQIKDNSIKEGKCSYCGKWVEGVW